MTLNDITSNAHFVALAGLGAILAAGWRQVRSFFSYIYGFLVVEAQIDYLVNAPITRCLRTRWHLVPTGKYWIVCYTMRHQLLRMNVKVPFRLPNHKSTYYRGRHILFVNGSPGNNMTIKTFRWTNIEDIIREALAMEVEQDKNLQRTGGSSRFCVHDVTGRDKSTMDYPSRLDGPADANTGSNTVSDNSVPFVFTDIDRSFVYEREHYTETPHSYSDGTIFLPPEAKQLLEETEKWFHQREWFQQRVIPWRRGMLLYGPGGTGKSTFALILARKLAIPIYRFHLNTLSNKEYMDKIYQMETPSVVLFEDFDRIFKGRESVENKHLSFDTVINSMSGVKTLEGVVFVLTTNNVDSIDPAIGVQMDGSTMSTRPGRVDRVLYMGAMADEQRYMLIDRTLGDWPDLVELAKGATQNFTIVQTQEFCVQLALQRIH